MALRRLVLCRVTVLVHIIQHSGIACSRICIAYSVLAHRYHTSDINSSQFIPTIATFNMPLTRLKSLLGKKDESSASVSSTMINPAAHVNTVQSPKASTDTKTELPSAEARNDIEVGWDRLENFIRWKNDQPSREPQHNTQTTQELPPMLDTDGRPAGSSFPFDTLQVVTYHHCLAARIARRKEQINVIKNDLEVATIRLKTYIATHVPRAWELLQVMSLEALTESWVLDNTRPTGKVIQTWFLDLTKLLLETIENQQRDELVLQQVASSAVRDLQKMLAAHLQHPRAQRLELEDKPDPINLPNRPADDLDDFSEGGENLDAAQIAVLDTGTQKIVQAKTELDLAKARMDVWEHANLGESIIVNRPPPEDYVLEQGRVLAEKVLEAACELRSVRRQQDAIRRRLTEPHYWSLERRDENVHWVLWDKQQADARMEGTPWEKADRLIARLDRLAQQKKDARGAGRPHRSAW